MKVTESIKKKNGNLDGAAFLEVNKKLLRKKVETRTMAINNSEGKKVEGEEEIKQVCKEYYNDQRPR